jgi:periodic tryptophan protein 1
MLSSPLLIFFSLTFSRMISAVTFLRRGVAASDPKKFELNEEEYKKFMEKAQAETILAKADLKEAQVESEIINDPELAEYNFEDYDKEMEVEDEGENFTMFSNIKGLTYYEGNEEDPYILKDVEDSDDDEDIKIKPSDVLMLAAKTEDEMSHLEVYLYEQEQQNMYVHHDIMLPSFPLCLEWIGHSFESDKGHGNFVAVGTFEPEIEIWNLDLIDPMYPQMVLGKDQVLQKPSKKKAKKGKANDEYHVDAVMCMSWNSMHSNVLASGSADKTIKIWDLNSGKAVKNMNIHSDKVQSLQWNKNETTLLLSGGYDKTVIVSDTRTDEQRFKLGVCSDVESVKWNPFDPNLFMVSVESGNVYGFDIRNASNAMFTLNAHDSAVTCLEFNPRIPNLFLTASTDKIVKLWDIKPTGISCIHTRDMQVGQIFSANFSYDLPYMVSAGGSKGELKMWNIGDSAPVRTIVQEKLDVLQSGIIVPSSNGLIEREKSDDEDEDDVHMQE